MRSIAGARAKAAGPTRPLRGLRVRALAAGVAPAVCAAHLTRLGASLESEGDADVVLAGAAQAADAHSPHGTLTCRFVEEQLDGGGLVGSETTAQAAMGITDYISGRGEMPARIGADLASTVTGFCATQAVLAWLLGDRNSGRDLVVELSPLRTLATLKTILIAARSRPDAWTGTHVKSRDRAVDSGYATRDGRITLDFPYDGRDAWTGFARAVGMDVAAIARIGDRWYETVGWGDDVDAFRPVYEAAFARLTADEAIDLIRSHGGSSVPFLTLDQCLSHPQAQALGLRESLERDLPWELSATGGARTAKPRGRGASNQPLTGFRVLDLGIGGVGPYAGALLAWLGADVLKVEAPNEFIHAVRPLAGGLSTTYLSLNQGKRSVRLNLKDDADRRRALRLVADADVLMENFRPGALDRVGFGFEDLLATRPDLVYASATGFGWTGPLAGLPCTDPHTQAFSGFAAGNADPTTGLPRRIRYYGFVDLVSSCVVAESILAALVARKTTGGPVRVRTSMLHSVTAAIWPAHAPAAPRLDGIFATLDGHVAVTCRDDDELVRTSEALGIRGGGDAVRDTLASLPSAASVQALGRAGIPCARLLHDDEINAREDFRRWGVLRKLPLRHAEPLMAGGPPWVFDGAMPEGPTAPYPGADTDSWLEES